MRKIIFLILGMAILLTIMFILPGCGEMEEESYILRVGFLREIESLNPMQIWSYQAYEIMNLNYNMLVSWDEDMNVIPNLAREWTVDADGLVWTFNLQNGVNWHDGEPFSADDVKFTYEYIRDNEFGYFYNYVASMEEIEVIDENSFPFCPSISGRKLILLMPRVNLPMSFLSGPVPSRLSSTAKANLPGWLPTRITSGEHRRLTKLFSLSMPISIR